MCDRGRTDSRLVGEGRPADALDQHTDQAAVHRLGVEGAAQDAPEGGRNGPEVGQNDPQGTEDVDAHHEGDNLVRHLGDGLDAAKNDHADDARHHGAEDPPLSVEKAGLAAGDRDELLGGLIDLHHVAASEGTANAGDGEQGREDLAEAGVALLGEAVTQVVHRTTRDRAVGILSAVLQAERALHELTAHAEQAGDDHPEGRAGATEGHRHGHTGNVADAHRAAQGRGQRLEMGHLPLMVGVVEFAAHHVQRMTERPDVDELEVDRKEEGSEEQPDQNERDRELADLDAPEDDRGDHVGDGPHHIVDGVVHRGGGGVEGQKEQGCQRGAGGNQAFHESIGSRWPQYRPQVTPPAEEGRPEFADRTNG